MEQCHIFQQCLHRNPCTAHALDILHPMAVILGIIADAAGRAAHMGKKADSLIVAQCIGRYVILSAYLCYGQTFISSFTL